MQVSTPAARKAAIDAFIVAWFSGNVRSQAIDPGKATEAHASIAVGFVAVPLLFFVGALHEPTGAAAHVKDW